MKIKIVLILAFAATCFAAKSYTHNGKTFYLIKTENGMMDIHAKTFQDANTIAVQLVTDAEKQQAQEQQREIEEAAKLLSEADIKDVDMETLTAIKDKIVAKEADDAEK